MTRWSAFLRNAAGAMPPRPVLPSMLDRLRALLVPELADLRCQLDDTRRLASETQAKRREAEARADEHCERARVYFLDKMDQIRQVNAARAELIEARRLLSLTVVGPIAMERDQLRARVQELETDVALRDADLTHGEDL